MEHVNQKIIDSYLKGDYKKAIEIYNKEKVKLRIEDFEKNRMVLEALICSYFSLENYKKSLVLLKEFKSYYKSTRNIKLSHEELSQFFFYLFNAYAHLGKYNNLYATALIYKRKRNGKLAFDVNEYVERKSSKISNNIKKTLKYFVFIYIFTIVARYVLLYFFEIDLTSNLVYNIYLVLGIGLLVIIYAAEKRIVKFLKKIIDYHY